MTSSSKDYEVLAKVLNPAISLLTVAILAYFITVWFNIQGLAKALTIFFGIILGLIIALLDPFIKGIKGNTHLSSKKEQEKLKEFLKAQESVNTENERQ